MGDARDRKAMGDAHDRYEELAVGHVLGGLKSRDASLFRTHLAGCRECRMRVAELRGIAADLAAAEQEEMRTRAMVTTEVVSGETEEDVDPRPPRQQRSNVAVGLAVLAVAVTLAFGLFWMFHLQRVNAQLSAVVETQDEVLEILANGEALPSDSTGDLTVTAGRLDERVAVSLAGLSAIPAEAVIVAWMLVDGEVQNRQVLADSDLLSRRSTIGFVLDAVGPGTVVVSIERRGGEAPTQPGETLASIDIDE